MEELSEKFMRCPQCNHFSIQPGHLFTTEKLKAYFNPVKAFVCTNCGYRFTEPVASGKKFQRILMLIIPVIILFFIVFFLPHLNDSPPSPDNKETAKTEEEKSIPSTIPGVQTQQNDEMKKTDEIKENTPKDENIDESDKPVNIESSPTPTAQPEPPIEIVFTTSRKFGVNWRNVERGVQISKLSDGPFKSAGIRLGDIIVTVDGIAITNGSMLMRARNDVYDGRRDQVIIEVNRDGQIQNYVLIKK